MTASRKMSALLLLVLTIPLLPACSTRAWYQTVQATARQECQRQPAAEQARCEAQLNQDDFERYEKAGREDYKLGR